MSEPVGSFTAGKEAEFMSRVRGRPFIFGEASKLETIKDHGRNSRWALKKIAERILENLDD